MEVRHFQTSFHFSSHNIASTDDELIINGHNQSTGIADTQHDASHIMLALAPPLHDHASPHNTSMIVGKTPSVRSKPVARRAPSSSALNSNIYSTSSTPSSSSLTSSSSAVVPSVVSRSSASSSQSRSEISHALKYEAAPLIPPTMARANGMPPAQQPIHILPSPSLDRPPSPSHSRSDNKIDIQSYPTPDLLRLLASLLNQIATANDSLSPPQNAAGSSPTNIHQTPSPNHAPLWDSLTTASKGALSTPTSPLTFHARNIPSISLEAYLLRILRYCPTTNEVFLSLLVYFDRMSRLAKNATGARFAIDSYNVHRLVIAGVTVASKFFSDVFYTNSRYAKVGGLPQAELNQLELQFLLLNDFLLVIPADEMQRYAEHLILYSQQQSSGPSLRQQYVNPVSIGATSVIAPSRPSQSMGAFDAFGGAIANDQQARSEEHQPRNTTPKRYTAPPLATYEPRDASEERDHEGSSVYSETDTDAETDDEPTIRPAHSSASSDTQSLFSNDASEDAFPDDEDDEDGSATDDERRTRERERPQHRRWNSSSSASVDADRHV